MRARRASRWVGRHRVPAAGIAIVLLALLVVAGYWVQTRFFASPEVELAVVEKTPLELAQEAGDDHDAVIELLLRWRRGTRRRRSYW